MLCCGVQGITIQHVWYYGWITALSTGLGTLPFLIVSDMNQWWLGVSNGTSLSNPDPESDKSILHSPKVRDVFR